MLHIKHLNHLKETHPIRANKLKFLKEKGKDFSIEQEHIAYKMQRLLENL